jgi:arginine/lysine/ornithine decarboxylase
VDRTYSYLYALKRESEYINLDDAVGKMSAENVGVSPPCVPVIVAGEIITEQAVNCLKENEKTFGVVDGKVKVVKK